VKRITTDINGPLDYTDTGGDGPPLVCVHGLGGSLLNWMPVVPGLSRSHRVLAVDLPGFGRSPPGGRRITVESQVTTVIRFIEKVAGGRCTLIGNSMGGLISLTVAAERPALVERLVLVNPALPRAPGVPVDPKVTLMLLAYMTPGVGTLVLRSRQGWTPHREIKEILGLCGVNVDELAPGVLDAMIELVVYRRTQAWAQPAFLEAARSVGKWMLLHPGRFRVLARSIRCPTLLIHGTKDRLVPVGFARAAAKMCPEWDTEILDGIGHVPQLQVPDRFVEIVGRFLDGARDGAPAGTTSRQVRVA
jgi:pimeloyl-ACP methyl ester carboxylesterase